MPLLFYARVISRYRYPRKCTEGFQQVHNDRYCTFGQKSNSYSTGATPLIYDYIWYKAAKGRLALEREIKIFLILRSVNVEHFKVLRLKENKGGKSLSNHEAIEATVKLIN